MAAPASSSTSVSLSHETVFRPPLVMSGETREDRETALRTWMGGRVNETLFPTVSLARLADGMTIDGVSQRSVIIAQGGDPDSIVELRTWLNSAAGTELRRHCAVGLSVPNSGSQYGSAIFCFGSYLPGLGTSPRKELQGAMSRLLRMAYELTHDRLDGDTSRIDPVPKALDRKDHATWDAATHVLLTPDSSAPEGESRQTRPAALPEHDLSIISRSVVQHSVGDIDTIARLSAKRNRINLAPSNRSDFQRHLTYWVHTRQAGIRLDAASRVEVWTRHETEGVAVEDLSH